MIQCPGALCAIKHQIFSWDGLYGGVRGLSRASLIDLSILWDWLRISPASVGTFSTPVGAARMPLVVSHGNCQQFVLDNLQGFEASNQNPV
jgi:hypothetical protein